MRSTRSILFALAIGLFAGPVLAQPYQIQTIESGQITTLDTNTGANHTWWISTSEGPPPGPAEPQEADELGPGWKPVQVPDNLVPEQLPEGTETVRYRKALFLPADFSASLMLRIGEISDRDRTYVNGTLIGETGVWEAERPQAYDRQRIYTVPAEVLRPGLVNIIEVDVRGFFPAELGIYRDETSIGRSREMLRQFYFENGFQIASIVIYGTVATYFLLFYFARIRERQYLYFSLFLFALLIYSFLRTQLKYELDLELFETKRFQYLALYSTFPSFYYFVRSFFRASGSNRPWPRAVDFVFHLGANGVMLYGAAVILLTDDVTLWDWTNNRIVQPNWLVYVVGSAYIMGREAIKKNLDGILMSISAAILVIALVLDILAGWALINVPSLNTYASNFFVLSMAIILASQFVRLYQATESLNLELARFNAASRRFVPFEFLRILEKGSISDVGLGDQVQREMTILFSDIRSFTTLSEGMTPKENFDFINSYMRRMAPVVQAHGGFIDKFIGDAIMALFSESSDDAVRAAIEMQRTVRDWNVGRSKHGLGAVETGVGLHRGKLMLGTIGTDDRMDGTVISDDVNLASRIEGLTRIYGAAVLLSDAIVDSLQSPGEYGLRQLDTVRVKGKRQSVRIFEVLRALPEEMLEKRLLGLEDFSRASNHYRTGEFREAQLLLKTLIKNDPADGAARFLYRRCRKFILEPPPHWDGISVLSSK